MMKTINAMTIQETLKNMEFISIPWIQMEYNLSYRQAKEFFNQLLVRGWADSIPEGNLYRIKKENLKLREIVTSEVDTLFKEVDSDCVNALEAIEKNGSATKIEILKSVRGEDDTNNALEKLLNNNLIYLFDKKYFSCISSHAIKVISKVVREKRLKEMDERHGNTSARTEKTIKKIFDELFD